MNLLGRLAHLALAIALLLPFASALTYRGADYSSLINLENSGRVFRDNGSSEWPFFLVAGSVVLTIFLRKLTSSTLFWQDAGQTLRASVFGRVTVTPITV